MSIIMFMKMFMKKKAIAAVDALKESRVLEQLYLVKFVN